VLDHQTQLDTGGELIQQQCPKLGSKKARLKLLAGPQETRSKWSCANASLCPGGPGMATCSGDLEAHPQTDCSPHGVSPWLNASEDACHKLGCCWHAHGLVPTGHMCVRPSYNSSSGCCESHTPTFESEAEELDTFMR
jgi:hypothetical protein